MIRILPFGQAVDLSLNLSDTFDSKNAIEKSILDQFFFTADAKSAFRIIAETIGLKREEEVYISTTSDSSFVSSCVTSTFFNYSKVSRVLTDNTKLIVIIHEFGFPNQKREELIKIGRERDIPTIEDKAHYILINEYKTADSDFIIHSLPKTFPIENGGLLIDKKGVLSSKNIRPDYLSRDLNLNHLSIEFLNELNFRRKSLYKLYSSQLNVEEVFIHNKDSVPFCFGFKSYSKQSGLNAKLSSHVELLRNYVDHEVLLPLNPFVEEAQHINLINLIKSIL